MNPFVLGSPIYASVILSDEKLTNTLKAGTVRGIRRAVEQDSKYRANDLGMQIYGNVIEELSVELPRFGFERTIENHHVQFEGFKGKSQDLIRISLCKGKQDIEQVLKVNKKGRLTKSLVDENSRHTYQLDFIFDEAGLVHTSGQRYIEFLVNLGDCGAV